MGEFSNDLLGVGDLEEKGGEDFHDGCVYFWIIDPAVDLPMLNWLASDRWQLGFASFQLAIVPCFTSIFHPLPPTKKFLVSVK